MKKFLSRLGNQSLQITFLKTVIENIPVAVFCKDANDGMKILLWNKTAEDLFGKNASQVIGKRVSDLYPPEEAATYLADDQAVISDGKPVFVPYRTFIHPKLGTEHSFRIWKVPVETAQGKLVLCIAQDTTEVMQVEHEKTEHERRLQSISNNLPGLLYQFKMGPDGVFSFPFFSEKARDYLGIESQEITMDANAALQLIHRDDLASFEQSLVKTIKDLSPWRWEGRIIGKDQKIQWMRGTSSPRKHEDGSIIWDGILFDITAQYEAEEKIKLQKANLTSASQLAAVGEMAGSVAHEINTPLNAILFSADQIQQSLKDSSFDKREIFEMSHLISETAQRIAAIVKSLRTFARDGSSQAMEFADLTAVIDQTMSLCAQRMQQNGVDLKFVRPSEPIFVKCRSVQLGQVILNLLNNAFDAVVNSKWGWIKIELRSTQRDLFIEITDSGKGLPVDVRQKLFQPFFTTKEAGKGTGIGLSISREIVQAHGGQLSYDESCPNTKFVLQLPRDPSYQQTG